MIRVLSLPSIHPYTSKFHNKGNIILANPNTDLFSEGKNIELSLRGKYPPSTYDIVHIHFSFDQVPVGEFEKLLKYFKNIRKPIVWTCHSNESQRVKNYEDGKYSKLLFKYCDKIISPTKGCAEWTRNNLGVHKEEIAVVPLGYLANPKDVVRLSRTTAKNRNLFTMLIGDFRENKEFVQSIINFLQCTELSKTRLQLIFKPINIYINSYETLNKRMLYFYNLLSNARITTISLPFISNDEIIKAFLLSHAIILPYKWGAHSGQIELAKDCGCHVVVSSVGFYKEQWEDICLYDVSDSNFSAFPSRYTNALIEVSRRKSIEPAGEKRLKEFKEIVEEHSKIYSELLSDKFNKQ